MNSQTPIRTREELVYQVEKGLRPKYLYFWGHTPPKNNQVSKSCFSQWFTAPFTLDDISYKTAEHYMMAMKAMLFQDTEVAEKIVACPTPSQAKRLGRTVKNFDEETWNAHRFEIVVKGNRAKFSQNESFLEFLLNTKERILVEASPPDRIWGIGMAEDNPKAGNPKEWRGLNLLGFALMEVRSNLTK